MLHEFSITMPYKTIEDTIECLNAHGIFHLYYEAPIDIIKTQNGYGYEERLEGTVSLKIYVYPEELKEQPIRFIEKISNILDVLPASIKHLIQEENQWNQSFELQDIDLGNGWVIAYPESQAMHQDKQILHFDPVAAFGTGLHETTQNCLQLILEKDFKGKRVLDLGTGSGILTIATALKQAAHIVAIDYEEVERELLHNASLNHITTPIDVIQADLLEGEYRIADVFDLIIINIGGDETVRIVERHSLLEQSNEFIISGMVEWHVDHVIELFKAGGFQVRNRLQKNEWVTLHFVR